jgi:hypothetical protein
MQFATETEMHEYLKEIIDPWIIINK